MLASVVQVVLETKRMRHPWPSTISRSAQPSNSEKPSRMSYYNENESLSVPFKWELAPGKSSVEESSQAHSPDQSPLKLRPPSSASNASLDRLQPPSTLRDHLLLKFSDHSPSEFEIAMSRSMSTSSATTADSRSSNGSFNRLSWKSGSNRSRVRSLSELDGQLEVSDEKSSSTARATDVQERLSTTENMAKLSSSSYNSNSSHSLLLIMDSPRGRGSSLRGGSTKEFFLWKNSVGSPAPSATSPANSFLPDAGRGSLEVSEVGEERYEDDDHARPTGGLLRCMPIFSKGDKTRLARPTIDCSTPPRPGMKNRSYRQSSLHSLGLAVNDTSAGPDDACPKAPGSRSDAPKVNPFQNIARPAVYGDQRNRDNFNAVKPCNTGPNYDAISCS